MAGDWIKFEHATIDKPEVLAMAEMLGTTSDDVTGKLLRVWIWFDQQSLNGDAGSVTKDALMRFIDRLVASQGFALCMKKVGWLTDSGIPNFDRHNGESAKNRALTRKRMKRLRDGDSVTKASPEKRREEKNINLNLRASRLPKGWSLPEDWKRWALEARPEWGDAEVLSVADGFRDYWLAAPNGSKLDWEATWRNWVRNTKAPPRAGGKPSLPSYT